MPGWDPTYQLEGLHPVRGAAVRGSNPDARLHRHRQPGGHRPEQYPYLLTEDWGYGTRSQRINDLIASKIKDGGKISMDDMQSMQIDNSSEIAETAGALPAEGRRQGDPYVRKAQKLLEGWDYNQDADSAAAAYFNAVWRNILKLAFGNKLPKELRPEGQCLRVPARRDSGPVDNLNGAEAVVTECGTRGRRPGAAGRRRPLVRGGAHTC